MLSTGHPQAAKNASPPVAGNSPSSHSVTARGLSASAGPRKWPARLAPLRSEPFLLLQDCPMKLHLSLAAVLLGAVVNVAHAQLPAQPGETPGALARAHAEASDARRREHRDARHRAGTEPAAERPVLPPLLRRAEHAARARIPERRLRCHRRREERLHHHQRARRRERHGDHRAAARQPLADGEGRRQGRGLGHRGASRCRRRTSRRFRSPIPIAPRSATTWSRSATRSASATPSPRAS